MNILWSIHLYPPKHNCGSEYVAHHVNKFLLSKGHNVRVIHHQSKESYIYEGVEVMTGEVGKYVDSYRWANVIMTHLDMTQFSIMMAHTAKRPIINWCHNDIPYSSIHNAPIGQYCVYNSDWIARALNYNHPSITLHPPCDINHYNVNDHPEWNEYITLISLNERKGGYIFKKIAEAMPGRKFLGVIGSYDNPGPMKLNQQQIIEMMPSNVTVIPNSPDILSIYRKTRILLMPSDYESWGRTATEAMCSGIPVICTPTEGLKENCGPAAIYVGAPREYAAPGEASVYVGKVSEWVRAIKYLDSPERYKKYSVACRRRAAELDPVKELEALEQFILNARF
jgi:glycosyltransferase involved in cell wall biosynthesis